MQNFLHVNCEHTSLSLCLSHASSGFVSTFYQQHGQKRSSFSQLLIHTEKYPCEQLFPCTRCIHTHPRCDQDRSVLYEYAQADTNSYWACTNS